MKYCKYCGNALNDNEACTCDEACAALKRSKSLKRMLVIASLAVVAVVAVVLAFTLTGDNAGPGADKLDPFEYIEVSFEGVDSKGAAIIDFDKDSLISELIEIDPEATEEEYIISWVTQHDLYVNSVEISYPEEKNLSNGDVITVTVTVSDVVRDKVKSGSKEYTVSGLEPITVSDIFADVEVVYEGVSGSAYASMNFIKPSDVLNACVFEFSSQHQLSNGDEITVSITNAAYLEEAYNVIPQYLSKTYKVSGLPSYVTSAEQLPMGVVQQIARRFYEEKQNELVYDGYFTYENITYNGTFLYISEEDSNFGYKNVLRVSVSYDMYMHGSYVRTNTSYLDFANVLIDSTGAVALDYDTGTELSLNGDEYTIIKINCDRE